ncbi:MAG: hypothetical protein IK130_09750 [Oscillospiraceae bacterium]|nr:hypothetical protein [Oscillospiraceae bacterium]
MIEMNMTFSLVPMNKAAEMLGYSLSFMNEICKRAYYSHRPFCVIKDRSGKYFIEANSLQRYINTCPDFNPYELPGVYEPDSDDDDAPIDDTVFKLEEYMLPQVCGVAVDAAPAPLIAYYEPEPVQKLCTGQRRRDNLKC